MAQNPFSSNNASGFGNIVTTNASGSTQSVAPQASAPAPLSLPNYNYNPSSASGAAPHLPTRMPSSAYNNFPTAPFPWETPAQFAARKSAALASLPAASSVLGTSTPKAQPTSAGGTTFSPSYASLYKNDVASLQPQNENDSADTQGLASLLTQTSNTAGGGTYTSNANGNPVSYTPSPYYSINNGGTYSSNDLGSGYSLNDVMNQQASYQDFVNALGGAQGYSPAYIGAQTGVYGAQANTAGVGAALVSPNAPTLQNYLNNPIIPGTTMGYANAVNGQEQALASQQQTQANIALNAQQLARASNIAQAQTQLQYNPTAMASQQAITQYQQLQQEYPSAGIPPFNPQGDPIQQYNMAAALVGQSPAYQAGFQSTYTTPGGGTGIYSRLDLSGFTQNSDGSYTLVPSAAAALGTANAHIVNDNLQSLAKINVALGSTQKIVQTTAQFMQQYGLNSTSVPIINQIQQNIQNQTTQQDAIAGLHNDLNALREDYAQYITARGGSVQGTGVDDPAILQAIPDTASIAQLQNIVTEMTQVGSDTASSVNDVVQSALQGIQTNTQGTTNNTGSSASVGTSWATLGQ